MADVLTHPDSQLNHAALLDHLAIAPSSSAPNDWKQHLQQLAKTAQLKKHAMDLQLYTSHILAAHAALDEKNYTLQDVKEQRNRVDSERARLIAALAQINEDRDKLDLSIESLNRDCHELRGKIRKVSDGDYSSTKVKVDALLLELGHSPLPTLQTLLDERQAAYLTARRHQGPQKLQESIGAAERAAATPSTPLHSTSTPPDIPDDVSERPQRRPRGRPRGSKNRPKSNHS